MRKSLLSLSALLAALASMSLGSPARADDKADIRAAYTKISAAMASKNIKAVMALGTPDFSETQHGKTYNAADSTKMMTEEFKQMKTLEATMTANDISVKGKTAVVKSSYVMKGDMLTPDGKTHKMSSTGTSRDTLLKTGKGWLFKKVEGLSEKTLLDGKPFDPSKMEAPKPRMKKMKS
jgi:ketosteroid isomerase-like protein